MAAEWPSLWPGGSIGMSACIRVGWLSKSTDDFSNECELIHTGKRSILTKYVKTLGVQEACNQRVFV